MRRLALAVLLAWSAPSFGLVITEIMYNQPGSAEDLEFIELYNEKVTPEDLSGYRFTRGIRYQFPTAYQANGRPVASLAPGGYLVLASDAARFQEHYGFAPFGQYFGRLSNSGERIVLENDAGDPFDAEFPENTAGRREGARIIDFAYNDTGQWPVACDGTGHTLCLIDPFRSQSCPTNWTASPTLWGTPGQPNGLEDQWIETELFPAGTQWRYIKGTSEPPSTWKDRTFNDTGWSLGAAPIGYGPHGHATDLSDMPGNYASFYARRAFSVANPSQVQGLALYVNWDDGFVAYINGQEVARENVTGTPPAHDTFAGSPTNPMGLIAFDISAVTGLLVAGTNVIAIQTHNVGHTSSDAFMDARLASRRLITAGGGDG